MSKSWAGLFRAWYRADGQIPYPRPRADRPGSEDDKSRPFRPGCVPDDNPPDSAGPNFVQKPRSFGRLRTSWNAPYKSQQLLRVEYKINSSLIPMQRNRGVRVNPKQLKSRAECRNERRKFYPRSRTF